jgi:hypothetical protein
VSHRLVKIAAVLRKVLGWPIYALAVMFSLALAFASMIVILTYLTVGGAVLLPLVAVASVTASDRVEFAVEWIGRRLEIGDEPYAWTAMPIVWAQRLRGVDDGWF